MNVLAAGVERLLIKRAIASYPQLAFARLSSGIPVVRPGKNHYNFVIFPCLAPVVSLVRRDAQRLSVR